ncbi:Serine carboxypeptidase-like 45 [Dionaea muscipula]
MHFLYPPEQNPPAGCLQPQKAELHTVKKKNQETPPFFFTIYSPHRYRIVCLCPIRLASSFSSQPASRSLSYLGGKGRGGVSMDPPFLLAAAIAIAVQLCHLRKIEASFSSHGDKISLLPGQPQVGFQQYAGYVTVDDRKHKTLFYYFVEAEVDPASKSLVLWLNGGPGCSSIGVGAFSENGPFRPKGEILVKNEHSWNGEANMLYLETPVGVGFSYAADTTAYSAVSDEMTARDNLIFLQRWFDKFPQYRHRDLFITGESYAGHYVPQLAMLMIRFNEKHKLFNLKGIALGNPVLEFATDFNSRAEYFWSHGLISDSTYSMFTSICNYSRYVSEYYRDSVSPVCSRVMAEVSRETSRFVDKYDVTLDVCMSSVLSQSKIINPQGEVSEAVDVCVEDETVNYLNRQDVQKALHARLINVRKWAVCSNILDYVLLDVEIPTISIIGLLIKRGVQVLVYSGDQDSVIPLTGSRTLVQQLARDLGLNTTIPYRAWFAGQQVGGWMEAYGDVLSFATIRGASHEAPFSQPERSLVLFKSFLEGRPLPAMF